MNNISLYRKNTPQITGRQVTIIDTNIEKLYKIPLTSLIETAGLRLAEFIAKKTLISSPIKFFIGSGNNGADGLVAAEILKSLGYKISIFITKEISKQKPINKKLISRLKQQYISIKVINDKSILNLSKNDILIDALLGATLSFAPKKEIKHIISKINQIKSTVISVDVPSGLNCSTGRLYSHHIKSTYILSFMCAKKGFKKLKASKIYIANIGINAHKALKEISSFNKY